MRAILLATTLALAGAPAAAAGDADAARGLVAEHCTACHEIPGYEARWERADLNAPAFVDIAGQPDIYPPERLRAFLGRPHWPMGQFTLSPSDIENVLAFIETLR